MLPAGAWQPRRVRVTWRRSFSAPTSGLIAASSADTEVDSADLEGGMALAAEEVGLEPELKLAAGMGQVEVELVAWEALRAVAKATAAAAMTTTMMQLVMMDQFRELNL